MNILPNEVIGHIVTYLDPKMIYRLVRKGFLKTLWAHQFTVINRTVIMDYYGPIKYIFEMSNNNSIVIFDKSYYETYTDTFVKKSHRLSVTVNEDFKAISLVTSEYKRTSVDYKRFNNKHDGLWGGLLILVRVKYYKKNVNNNDTLWMTLGKSWSN